MDFSTVKSRFQIDDEKALLEVRVSGRDKFVCFKNVNAITVILLTTRFKPHKISNKNI